MPNPIHIELAKLERKIQALHAEIPELEDDEELKTGMIEGETNAYDILDRAIDRIRHEEFLQGAIEQRKREMTVRHIFSQRRETFWRRIVMKVMEMANIRKAQLAEATLSVSASPQETIITDETLIPEEYWRIKRELNKELIRKELRDGAIIPGATLSNKEDRLVVKSK